MMTAHTKLLEGLHQAGGAGTLNKYLVLVGLKERTLAWPKNQFTRDDNLCKLFSYLFSMSVSLTLTNITEVVKNKYVFNTLCSF